MTISELAISLLYCGDSNAFKTNQCKTDGVTAEN
jgi:hypothetical protein